MCVRDDFLRTRMNHYILDKRRKARDSEKSFRNTYVRITLDGRRRNGLIAYVDLFDSL